MKPYKTLLILILSLIPLLTGCTNLYDPESSQEFHTDAVYLLAENQVVTQTIFLSQPALHSISFWVGSEGNSKSGKMLRISIYSMEAKPRFIYAENLAYPSTNNQLITLTLPLKIELLPGKYSFILQSDAKPLQLYGCLIDCYNYGAIVSNGTELSSDLGFVIRYRYTFNSVWQDLSNLSRNFWLSFPLMALLLVPGYFLLKLLPNREISNISTRLFIMIALSLSSYPLLMSWTSLFGLSWNFRLVKVCLYIGLVILIFNSIHNRKTIIRDIQFSDFLVFLIFTLTLLLRFQMIRNLVAPPWVDSVHHAVITRLILDQGGFPHSYQPYINLENASYHSGFHAILAVFVWITDLSLPPAMLILGQVINALAVLSVYSFSKKLFNNTIIGILSAVIVGFILPIPAYLTSWGRYTHLLGTVLLSAPFLYFDNSFSNMKKPNQAIPFAILSSGLIITHYRVSLFFAILLLVIIAQYIFSQKSIRMTFHVSSTLKLIFLLSFLVLILSLPWLPQAWSNLILPKLQSWRITSSSSQDSIPYHLFTFGYGWIGLIAMALGFALGLIKKEGGNLILLIWTIICYGTVFIPSLGISGFGLVNYTSVTISMFPVIAALGAYGVYWIAKFMNRFAILKHPIFMNSLLTIFIVCTYLLTIPKMVPIINPITMLVREDDLIAMDWIKNNISSNEQILIQPFLWGYGLYAGNDGGTWIPALAKRATIPPPVLYGLSGNKAEINHINLISQRVLEYRNSPFDLANWMKINELDYLYLGGRGGEISPWLLHQSGHFQIIYHQDSVYILKPIIPNMHR